MTINRSKYVQYPSVTILLYKTDEPKPRGGELLVIKEISLTMELQIQRITINIHALGYWVGIERA